MKKIVLIIVTILFIALSCNSQIIPKTNIVSTNTLMTVNKSGQSFSLTVNGSGASTQSVITSPNGSLTVSTANEAILSYIDDSNLISFVPSQLDILTSSSTSTSGISTNSSENISMSVYDESKSSVINIFDNKIELFTDTIYQNSIVKRNGVLFDGKASYINTDITNTSNTVFVNTGLKTDTLEIGHTYYIEAYIHIGCSGTGGVRFTFNHSDATLFINGFGNSSSSTAFRYESVNTLGATGQAFNTFANANGYVRYNGTINTIDKDVLSIAFQSVTNGQTSTMFSDGSYFSYRLVK